MTNPALTLLALPTLALLGLAAATTPAHAQRSPFDGAWAATVSCPPVADATGYTLRFPARVTASDFLGENGSPGQAGYLHLAGHIQPDGTALLAANGLVGNPRTAIGGLPSLSSYRYTATTRFTPTTGAGTRTSVRPCSLDFVRSPS